MCSSQHVAFGYLQVVANDLPVASSRMIVILILTLRQNCLTGREV